MLLHSYMEEGMSVTYKLQQIFLDQKNFVIIQNLLIGKFIRLKHTMGMQFI